MKTLGSGCRINTPPCWWISIYWEARASDPYIILVSCWPILPIFFIQSALPIKCPSRIFLIVVETIRQMEFKFNIHRYLITNYFCLGSVLPRLIPNDNWIRMPAAVVDQGWTGRMIYWWTLVDRFRHWNTIFVKYTHVYTSP